MEHVAWSQELTLGAPGLDKEHKEFLDELVALSDTIDDDFVAGFLALTAHLETHFNEEERMMENIDYPGLLMHREQHARVLGGLHHVAPNVMQGDIAAGREAIELLPQWFLFHLSTMDAALAVALDLAAQPDQVPALQMSRPLSEQQAMQRE